MKYFIFFILWALPALAQITAVWIQYDLITGAETGTNSRQVSNTDLAALGKGQIEYTGAGDATRMRVDLTQTPPAIVPDSPSQ